MIPKAPTSNPTVISGHTATVWFARTGIIHHGTRRRETVVEVPVDDSTASSPGAEPVEPK
ncbi:hypothetical protein HDU96_003624 [Phlyctochytrium bullatum]|nr:hypothetical protein HDU96_003624 [Phlyctochytrium bullatum]